MTQERRRLCAIMGRRMMRETFVGWCNDGVIFRCEPQPEKYVPRLLTLDEYELAWTGADYDAVPWPDRS